MSPSGLRKFLDGSSPYSATQRKLERWYVRESARYGGGLSVGSAFAALSVLVQDLPPQRRRRVLEEMLEMLQREYGDVQEPIPGWLEVLPELIRWEE